MLDLEGLNFSPIWAPETIAKGHDTRIPNPDCALAQGLLLYTSFIDIFGDNVSGNQSKSWIKHWNIYISHRNGKENPLHQTSYLPPPDLSSTTFRHATTPSISLTGTWSHLASLNISRLLVEPFSLPLNLLTFRSASADTHKLHLPSKNMYLAHRHTLRLSLFMRARVCAITLSLQYYTITHIAPSPDTSCHHFEPSDTSSALATHPIA